MKSSDIEILIPWVDLWYNSVSRLYLETYVEIVKGQEFIPKKKRIDTILQLYLLEKSIYEVGYELNNRPDWIGIPLQGVKHFISSYIDDAVN